MTKKEMVDNLGTICNSGSKTYIESMKKKEPDAKITAENIIGQFGVGFYSVFIVSDKVEVISKADRKNDENDYDKHVWASDGGGTYTIGSIPSD